jgi:hypothetical protein
MCRARDSSFGFCSFLADFTCGIHNASIKLSRAMKASRRYTIWGSLFALISVSAVVFGCSAGPDPSLNPQPLPPAHDPNDPGTGGGDKNGGGSDNAGQTAATPSADAEGGAGDGGPDGAKSGD